ncbi:amidohydrolase family protein [Zooshikella marina]|uniref:amidohydrolase family protein n=1 Tax=Zooshikella ganghwensis TaxID=202772 RepID=UPI001BB0D006|nr:amidohydrolase family protein [Zooshikella ganghwensis]MBU2708092.1 amidohydrolase family protein [Zooshikella ganghwensis]
MPNLCKRPLFLFNILTAYHILFNALCYATTSPSTFIINNISVVNPDTGTIDKNRSVFIQKGIIKHITSSDSIRDINIKIIDGSEKYLIPGLIDSHVHISGTVGMQLPHEKKHPEIVKLFNAQLPRCYLYHGFTTLVDLGAYPGRVEAFKQHVISPEIYSCGSSLMLENGYPALFQPKENRVALFPNLLFNPQSKTHLPGLSAIQNNVRNSIKRVINEGGICVKSYHEDGFAKSIWPVPSNELQQTINHEAAKHNLPSIVHANSINAYKAIINSGVNIIAHGMWNWDEFKGQSGVPQEIKTTLENAVNNKVAIMPTFRVVGSNMDLFDSTFLHDKALTHVLPKQHIAWLKTPEANWFKTMLLSNLPKGTPIPEVLNIMHNIYNQGQRAFQYFYQLNGQVVFGSDTPSSPSYGSIPGLNGYLELRAMAMAGMTLKDILASATINNARALGLDQSIGSITEGKTANLLILDKNPLETISAYNAIDTVIIKGQAYKRSFFSAKSTL